MHQFYLRGNQFFPYLLINRPIPVPTLLSLLHNWAYRPKWAPSFDLNWIIFRVLTFKTHCERLFSNLHFRIQVLCIATVSRSVICSWSMVQMSVRYVQFQKAMSQSYVSSILQISSQRHNLKLDIFVILKQFHFQ